MRLMIVVAFATSVVFVHAASAAAQTWNPPPDSQRCPSKWGAGDQRGAANHMKAETVLRATRLIRMGQVFELGRRLEEGMPLQTTRTFELHTKRTAPLAGSNRRGSNEEIVLAEIGQVGTQFDNFAHQTIGDSLYNCFKLDDFLVASAKRFEPASGAVRFVCSSNVRVVCSGIPSSSRRPSSNTCPIRIRRAARSTVSAFMWFAAPR